ncbi:hypothetical protein [Polaribacter sp.]|uniref:hypothetical protein n=1 Tax=Polaribacter sp. TaxID=1920175 RepID=UPI0040474501
MKYIKTIKLTIIIIFVSININSQTILNLNIEKEYTFNGDRISMQENFVVKDFSNIDLVLLNKLETYCNTKQSLINNKYLDHTYIFFKYEKNILDNNIQLTIENLYNNKIKAVAILRYHKIKNGSIEKRFMLLNNGEVLKYFINGVEKQKI